MYGDGGRVVQAAAGKGLMDAAIWLMQHGADAPSYTDGVDLAVHGQLVHKSLTEGTRLMRGAAEQLANSDSTRRNLQQLVVGAALQLRRAEGIQDQMSEREGQGMDRQLFEGVGAAARFEGQDWRAEAAAARE